MAKKKIEKEPCMEQFVKPIKLHDNYLVDRPDTNNFVLYHYEDVSSMIKGEDGKFVKYLDEDGKERTQTEIIQKWVWKGYYGTLSSLYGGMMSYECRDVDCKSMQDLLKLIKKFEKEVKEY